MIDQPIFVVLSWCILVVALLPFHQKEKGARGRVYLKGLSILLLGIEFWRVSQHVASGDDLNYMLFNVGADFCNQMAIILPLTVLFNLKKLWPAIGIPAMVGGIFGMSTSLIFVQYGLSAASFQSLLSHILFGIIPVVMMQTSDYRPEYRHLGVQNLFLLIMMGIALLASLHYNYNFAFILSGDGLPLMGKIPWPWYWVPFIALIEASVLLITFVLKRLSKVLFPKVLNLESEQ
ncbi:TMEM164 family acyltransferase [Eubacterium aggregans]|uniref:TMEM164 family acyltransferase n=1 Tax=Eubacterium aggregans TaxID=81409 RepID=UPI003F330924